MPQYNRKDHVYQKAKESGVRSRAYFKLEELNRRHKLLRAGQRVVDLGAWPGGWSEYCAKAVGTRGRVVGIDLKQIEPLKATNAHFVTGDVMDESSLAQVRDALGGEADVVLSDMSPKLSGIRECDDAGIANCLRAVLVACNKLLRLGGTAVAKVFPGSESDACIEEFRQYFGQISRFKLKATRSSSSELYLVAKRYLGNSHQVDEHQHAEAPAGDSQ